MRKLFVVLCSFTTLALAASVAWAAEPTSGTLSVERGKGVVMIDLRGSVLGRLTLGSLRVTDQTPSDKYAPLVVGKKVTQERVGPRTVIYRGQGLRFRLVGGGYRMVAHGTGISVSAVGRGVVMLDGEPRWPGDDVGIYSSNGADCSTAPETCTPVPTDPARFALEPPPSEPSPGAGP
jgi:hypothetical protein